MDEKMVEYYKQVAELQNLAREREQQRLALEREAIQRLQMREKRREEIWKKIKKLRSELVDDELKSSQRIRVLQARVDALSHEQKLLAMHTEKLRIKKRHYELLLFANYSKLQDVPPHVTQHLSNVRYDWSPLDDSKRVHFATTPTSSTPYAEDKDQAIISPSLFSAAQAFSSVSTVPPLLSSSYLYSTLPSQMSTSATYTFANAQSRDVTNGMSRSNTAHELRVPDSLESLQRKEDQMQTVAGEVSMQGTLVNKQIQRTSGDDPTSLISGDIQSSKEHTTVREDGVSCVGMPRMPLTSTHYEEELFHRMPVTSQQQPEQEQREVTTQKGEMLQRFNGEMEIGTVQDSEVNNDISVPIQTLQSTFIKTPSSGNQLLIQPQHSVDSAREKEPPDEIDFRHSATFMNNVGMTSQGYAHMVSTESYPNKVLPSSTQMTSAAENTQTLSSQGSSSAQQSNMSEAPDRRPLKLLCSASDITSDSLNVLNASHVSAEGAVAADTEAQEPPPLPSQRTVNEISSTPSGYSSLNMPSHHTGVPSSVSVAASSSRLDKNLVPGTSEDQSYLIHERNTSHSPIQPRVEAAQEENRLKTFRKTELHLESQLELQSSSSQQHRAEETVSSNTDQTEVLPAERMIEAKESPVHGLTQPHKAQQHSAEVETVKGKADLSPEYSKPMDDVVSDTSEEKTSTQSSDLQMKCVSLTSRSSPDEEVLQRKSVTSIKEPEHAPQSPRKGLDPPPVKAVSKAPFIIKVSEDEDDDFFDKKVPVTESAAYRSLLGTAGVGMLESDSDELEAQMASLIAKPQEKSKLKPFSAVASLHSARIPTDSDSVDSVEAAILAATRKDATSTVCSSPEKKSGLSSTAAPKKQDSTKEIKSKPSSALQIRLESDSESYDVSGGGGGSDQEDDFDFD